MVNPAYIAEILRQLAFLASFLAGFGITVGVSSIKTKETKPVILWFYSIMLLSASLMIVTVCISSIGAIFYAFHKAGGSDQNIFLLLKSTMGVAGKFFLLGLLSFLAGIALSGWTKSFVLGIFSTSLTVFALFAIVLSVFVLVDIDSEEYLLLRDLLWF